MDSQFYSRNDTIEFNLFAAMNPVEEGGDFLEALFEAIGESAGPFLPESMSFGGKDVDFSAREARKKLLRKKKSSINAISLSCGAKSKAIYSLCFMSGASEIGFTFWLAVPMNELEGPKGSDGVKALKALAITVSELSHPQYGFAHSRADLSLGTDPHFESAYAENKVYEAHWLNIYGPDMVSDIGREKFLATPDATITKLNYGGVLWTMGDTPVDFATRSEREKQAAALAHLSEGLSIEEAQTRLFERSDKMAEVVRDWDPDIEDLLELTLDEVLFAERQAETLRLNSFRPPEVSEWHPLAELMPVDVEDEEEVIEDYDGLFAEQLVALLHSEIPEVMDGGPGSLPLIDCHLWQFGYPERFPREDIEEALIPAVGAYLGDVIINHLGGKWEPREKLDESQLVVGDRAWLPFLRARHLLQSKSSVLEHSMTQFYHTIARHVG